jgi:hypothetical protein
MLKTRRRHPAPHEVPTRHRKRVVFLGNQLYLNIYLISREQSQPLTHRGEGVTEISGSWACRPLPGLYRPLKPLFAPRRFRP